MRYLLMTLCKKITAFFTSILVSLGIMGGTAEEYVPFADENTVSAYSTEKSDYSLSVDAGDEVHSISDLLYGIFFEDINFAADGGLYGEMVINRSFEYGSLATDDELHGWSAVGTSDYSVKVGDAEGGLNSNNTNYLVINNTSGEKAGVANRGFLDGMAVESGVTYDFSVYAKALDNYGGKITVRLVAGEQTAAEGTIDTITADWAKYELELTSTVTANENVYLQVLVDNGKVALDMISLFPPTYKDHGMRADLAQMLADLEPAFLRFPGGCVIEGYDEETAYNWKDSIGVDENGEPIEWGGVYGDVAARSYGINIWTDTAATDDPLPCYMSYGLGFYEYFVLAEDIGAIGVPVLNCGLYCQMRGKGPVDMNTELFEQYLQDMVDLVEFCRGDETTKWGKVRISMGHAEPFELKYICIGNENEAEDYYERYEAFLARFNEEKEKNPELYEGLELIYSAGAAEATSGWNYYNSYVNAYNYVAENDITIEEYAGAIDQHYYMMPDWFLENTDYYDEDNYVRDYENMTDTIYGGAIQVFVGEYAAKSNTLEAALAEAAYMTGLERNGDIVRMAAYAPLFGNLTATHWSPDLIWFDNDGATGSINYYMQKLFSNNVGTTLIASSLDGADIVEDSLTGMVGLGTWNTTAEFDNVKVVSNETGEVLSEDSFDSAIWFWDWYKNTDGKWKASDGKFTQTELYPDYSELGACVYCGDTDWSDYTFTVEATKTEGEEGFYIPFLIEDENNCFYWNIGGWGNTQTALQRLEDGVKTGAINGTVTDFTVETGVTYEIKIVVDGVNIKGYIDDVLMFDYDAESDSNAEAYQVVSTDESGDIIIKLVNVTENDRTFAIDIENAENIGSTATVYQVAGESLADDNILGEEEKCKMVEFTVDGISAKFNYTVPQYSATVIRITR
ncbi:MAG: carbohydrate binding domain-containing protein [Clostridia bacterium]|nr:carbohydrate binding domain-containing protein [Clostridia bacterium]